MYLDRRLWAFTRGVRAAHRGHRAARPPGRRRRDRAPGALRLAPRPRHRGRPAALAAAAHGARGGRRRAARRARLLARHGRRTARPRACRRALRQAIYERVTALGPAHFTRSRTGDVILSMVEGVQQLEVYFGQYLPQLAVAALTPTAHLRLRRLRGSADRARPARGRAASRSSRPSLWHRKDSRQSLARSKAYAAFGAEFLDSVQGLATLKAFGQSGARGRAARRARARRSSTAPWACSGRTRWRAASRTPASPSARRRRWGWGAWRVAARARWVSPRSSSS